VVSLLQLLFNIYNLSVYEATLTPVIVHVCLTYVLFLFHDRRAGIAKENHDKVFNEMVQFSPNELQAGICKPMCIYVLPLIVDVNV
jgi:hypothetical protein